MQNSRIRIMETKKITIATGVMLSLLILPSVSSMVYAQYTPLEKSTGLEDLLQLSKDKVKIAAENPGKGSGTPMFAADGILGAIVLSTGIFGGIAAAFFVRGKKGKYAAIGRG